MEASVLAAIVGGSVSVVLNIFQFLTNRRLITKIEKEKFEYQLKLEKVKLNYSLLKPMHEAKQKYIGDITNALYKLRKAIEVVKDKFSIKPTDNEVMLEINDQITVIDDYNTTLKEVYLENQHLSPLISKANAFFSHKLGNQIDYIKLVIRERPSAIIDKEEYLKNAILELYDEVLSYEQQFKALIASEYDELLTELN